MKTKLWLLLFLVPCLVYAGTVTFYQNAGTTGSAAYVQSKSCSALGTSEPCAYTSNVTAGNLLIVGCILGTATDTFSVTDNKGNIYTAVGASSVSNTGGITNVFYAKNSVAGATTVTCTDTGATASWVQLSIHEYSGLDTGNPFDVTNSSAPVVIYTTTTIVTGYSTTASPNELMFGFVARSPAAPTSQNGTQRENFVDNVFMASQDTIISVAGVYQSSWTIPSNPLSSMAIQASFRLPKGRGAILSQ